MRSLSARDLMIERAVDAITAVTSPPEGDSCDRPDLSPPRLREQMRGRGLLPGEPNTWPGAIEAALPALPGTTGRAVVVTGTLDRRLLAVHTGGQRWVLADLAGRPHCTRMWPTWAVDGIDLDDSDRWLSWATLTDDAVRRLTRPRIVIAALYRREVFPLPRFSLSVCDLARAARSTLSGHVEVIDMQLGATVEDILRTVEPTPPPEPGPGTGAGAVSGPGSGADVLGLSATFGQHDLLTAVLDEVFALPRPPLVLAGGSLTARNERLLLERYPDLLVARGAGEPTITDTIAHWHGDLTREQIRGVGYAGRLGGHPGGRQGGARPAPGGIAVTIERAVMPPTPAPVLTVARTAGVANRDQGGDYLPELDLLEATFAAGGVAQLETSRGCTSSCSFCPRGHKGSWAGADPAAFTAVLDHMREAFDRHPDIARVLYLVDEEFIGADHDAVPRAHALAETLYAAGYRWETSCRVDQVSQPAADRAWHVERAHLWRHLLDHGLRRCLFGIESGVTSILERFHKETTAEQNATAIRTLSALGVPTRYTYITFDHLMTLEELQASHAFQGRTDLILRPLPHLPVEDIVDGVHDPAFITAHATGRPFYRGISYMLVSMECLIGAAYTRRAQAAGLTGAVRPSMGRVDARFADPRIGVCSDLA